MENIIEIKRGDLVIRYYFNELEEIIKILDEKCQRKDILHKRSYPLSITAAIGYNSMTFKDSLE